MLPAASSAKARIELEMSSRLPPRISWSLWNLFLSGTYLLRPRPRVPIQRTPDRSSTMDVM